MKNPIQSERKSDRELVTERVINGPAHLVFEAWTRPELFRKWWVPKSFPIKLESCEMDVRTGGGYRLRFSAGGQIAEFFGKYLEVTPNTRLVWTNDEAGEEAAVITTLTLKEIGEKTQVKVLDLYPSKDVLDEAISTGSSGAMPEQLEQLDQLMAGRKTSSVT